MAKEELVTPFAEFHALPLSSIIAQPLIGALEAHRLAAETTMAFIEDVKDKKVEFTVAKTDENGSPIEKRQVHIEAPLLAVLPVPNIRIDSISINFRYEIKHTIRKEKETKGDIDLKAGAKGLLSSLLDVSLSGSVASRSATESESNRSGTLEISLQASEAEMPEGLRKILNLLSNSITISEEKTAGGKQQG